MKAFPITQFGGLRLDLEPDEVGQNQAIDLLNVDFDHHGAVRSRSGYSLLFTVPAPPSYLMCPDPDFIVQDGSTLRAYKEDGTAVATVATTGYKNIAQLGTGAAGPFTYIGGTNAGQIRRYDGAAFSAPGGMPNAAYVAVQPTDNRLAAFNTAAATKSRISFSDPGAPETWGANNYVDLAPNDGEEGTGLVAWRDSLFAFKQTKFAWFYGNSVDGAGNPVFNYRWINARVGAGTTGTGVTYADALPDAVYFANRAGVYRTTGGVPEKVSGVLDPFFAVGSAPWFHSGDVLASIDGLACVGGRVFVGATLGSIQGVFVFDPILDLWLWWESDAGNYSLLGFVNYSSGATGPNRVALIRSGGSAVHLFTPSATTDAGTAIASKWRSGFYTVGNTPDQEVTIRESVIDGTGTPSFSVSRDFGAIPASGGGAKTAVTLGTSPATAQGRHRAAQRGRRFSSQIEATSGAWLVESATQKTIGVREEGLKTA